MLTRTLLGALGAVLVSTPLAAHDFWIQPATFRPARDARVALDLRVGERFVGDEVPRKEARILRFTATDATSTTPIAGIEEKAPAGFFRGAADGLHWIAYASRPTAIELEARKFESYLLEEGLEHVIAARKERDESEKPGKEQYARCAKALLAVGDAPHAGFDRVLGLALELVPVNDPSTLRPGDSLELRLLHDGKPLAGALVGCRAQAAPDVETRVRTDAEGRVEFVLRTAGPTLVRVVHMVPAPKGSGADWSSLWASLTFEALPKTADAAPAKKD